MTATPYIRPSVTRKDISHADMRALIDCDPKIGELKWRRRDPRTDKFAKSFNTKHAGNVLGSTKDTGLFARVQGDTLCCADIVWFMVHGRWPDSVLSHLDSNPYNCAISNLRETGIEGSASARRSMELQPDGSWVVIVAIGEERVNLGTFPNAPAAETQLRRAAEMLRAWVDLV